MYTIIKKRKEKLVYCGESCEGIDLAEHLTYSVQYTSRVHTFYVYCVTVVCVNYLWIIDAIAAGKATNERRGAASWALSKHN